MDAQIGRTHFRPADDRGNVNQLRQAKRQHGITGAKTSSDVLRLIQWIIHEYVGRMTRLMRPVNAKTEDTPVANNALDTEPPIASFLKSMLIGGGPVNAADYEVLGLASGLCHHFWISCLLHDECSR